MTPTPGMFNLIMTSTSFAGAWLVVTGMTSVITGANSLGDIEHLLQARQDLFYITLFCWLLLGICGMIMQFKWLQLDLKRKERSLADFVNRDGKRFPRKGGDGTDHPYDIPA